jgi:hypothetical protein
MPLVDFSLSFTSHFVLVMVSPSLIPHSLNLSHRLLEGKFKQSPPSLSPQILAPLASPNMEFLLSGLGPNPVHHTIDLDIADGRGQIHAPLRLDVHLPPKHRPQLQLNTANGDAIVIRPGRLANRIGEGTGIGRGAWLRWLAQGLLCQFGLFHRLGGLCRLSAAEVELLEDAIDLIA